MRLLSGNVADEVEACLAQHVNPLLGHAQLLPFGYGALRNLLLGLHLWEEEHLLDVGLARHEHHKAVDADADTARRRHTILQSAQEVVVDYHSLVVALVGKTHLFLEAFLLVNGVVELRVGIGQLLSVDHQLETLGQPGL